MTASYKCHHVSPERRRTEAAAAQTRSRVLLPTIFNIAEGYVILTNPPHPPNIHLCVCFLFFSFFLLTHSSLSRGKTRHRSPAIPVLLMPRRCHLGAPVAPRRRCAGCVCVCVCVLFVRWGHQPCFHEHTDRHVFLHEEVERSPRQEATEFSEREVSEVAPSSDFSSDREPAWNHKVLKCSNCFN